MNDYSRYTSTIKTDTWTHVPIKDDWLDPRHVFDGRCDLNRTVMQWLKSTPGGTFAVIEDHENYIHHFIAFSRPEDATFFMLMWS